MEKADKTKDAAATTTATTTTTKDSPPNNQDDAVPAPPQKTGDWILELFAPSYATAADVLEGKHEPKEEAVPKIKLVSAFDPQSIQNVYERVHMMIKMDEEMKKEAAQARTHSHSDTQPAHAGSSAVKKRSLSLHQEEEDEEEGGPAEKAVVDLSDSGIWNSEELSVLRGVFRAAKSQICSLEVKLRQEQRHNAELQERLDAQTKALDTKCAKLSEATKANHRLKIHCDELQVEVKEMGMKVGAVSDMWHEMDVEKQRLMKQTQQARVALDRERMARQQLELKLQDALQQAARDKMLAEENAKVKYEVHIHKLEQELSRVKGDLAQERQLAQKDRRALDHLRTHFASLPLHDVLPAGMVATDQVSTVDHVTL